MPKAARILDMHTCPMVNPGPVPHVGGPISSGSPNVNIGYLPAARVDDTAVCVPATDAISKGSSNVFINHKQAARIGDPTKHGGVIVAGCATVNIGESPQSFVLRTASLKGTAFCEECEQAKRQTEELRRPPPQVEPPTEAAKMEEVEVSEAVQPSEQPPPHKLAKQTNQADDNNAARRQAREKVAWDFLASHAQQLSPAQVESQLRNIDLDSPVSVVSVPASASSSAGGATADSSAAGAGAGDTVQALKSRHALTGEIQFFPS